MTAPLAVSGRILRALADAVDSLDNTAESHGVTFEGTATVHDLDGFAIRTPVEVDEDGLHYVVVTATEAEDEDEDQ